MIHVKKVMEHVYEKIVLSDNSSNSSSGGADKMPPDELSALADAKVEIHCNDMVRWLPYFLFPFTSFITCLSYLPMDQRLSWHCKSSETFQICFAKFCPMDCLSGNLWILLSHRPDGMCESCHSLRTVYAYYLYKLFF